MCRSQLQRDVTPDALLGPPRVDLHGITSVQNDVGKHHRAELPQRIVRARLSAPPGFGAAVVALDALVKVPLAHPYPFVGEAPRRVHEEPQGAGKRGPKGGTQVLIDEAEGYDRDRRTPRRAVGVALALGRGDFCPDVLARARNEVRPLRPRGVDARGEIFLLRARAVSSR